MTVQKYNTKKGIRWSFTVYLGQAPDGKPLYKSGGGFLTKTAAKSAERQALYDFDEHGFKRDCPTYKEVYEMWLPLYKDTVQVSTFNKTVKYFDNHILPVFADCYIDEISVSMVQAFIQDMSDKVMNYKRIYRYARKVFEYAWKVDIVSGDNPFDKVIFPKSRKSQPRKNFLEKEELDALLKYIDNSGNIKWYTYFYLLAYTGLRKGEGLALKWNDISFIDKTLTVNKTISQGLNYKEYLSDVPKTEAGNRTIYLDSQTLDVLREWKSVPKKIVSLSGNDFVFPNTKGSWTCLSKPYAYLKKALKACNLPHISVHGLRHTHCSMLFEAGWSVKEVQDRLGHSDIKTTMNIYAHVTKNIKDKNIEKWEQYLTL